MPKHPEGKLKLYPTIAFARQAKDEGGAHSVIELRATDGRDVSIFLTRDLSLSLRNDFKRDADVESLVRGEMTDRRKQRLEVVRKLEEVMRRLHAAAEAGDDEMARVTFIELSEVSLAFASTFEGCL